MLKKRVITRKLYEVNCYTIGGYNYATHYDCTLEEVKKFQKLAKLLNEKITYECCRVVKYEY